MEDQGYYGKQYGSEQEEYGDYEGKQKAGNTLPIWGNQRTMNLNNLILTNIQSSPYFKVKLYELKTYHEVIDEIYYKIDNLEPWERGSRKTTGQTGMCGGVRGVGTGGIVSTAYCILYKLFTLKLTRKQLNGMLNHSDSPYIRGLGLMYIRYCQPPKDLYAWFEPYLDDDEEIDPKAGGGAVMTIGSMARTLLSKLEWFETLFPRIPVPIQKQIEEKLKARMMAQKWARTKQVNEEGGNADERSLDERPSRSRSEQTGRSPHRRHSRGQSYDRGGADMPRRHGSGHGRSHDRHRTSRRRRSRDRKNRSRSSSPQHSRKRRSRSRDHDERSRSGSEKNREYKSHERRRKKEHRSRRER